MHEFKQTSADAKSLTADSLMRALSVITTAPKRGRKRDRTEDMKVRVDAFLERVVRRILRNGEDNVFGYFHTDVDQSEKKPEVNSTDVHKPKAGEEKAASDEGNAN